MENKEFLNNQLIRLGDMMGDGLHREPGGKWISQEYKRVCKALGIWPKRKSNASQIDTQMKERVLVVKCQSCKGMLKQTRSGSMRGVCVDCGAKFQLLKRKKG